MHRSSLQRMTSLTNVEASGSSLTYVKVNSTRELENKWYYFVGINIKFCKKHTLNEFIVNQTLSGLTTVGALVP